MNYRINWKDEGLVVGATYMETSSREHAKIAANLFAVGATAKGVTSSAELDKLASSDVMGLGDDHSFATSSALGYAPYGQDTIGLEG